jgi:hypothetical protein
MGTFSAKGFLECQSQYADPIKGRGELTATDRDSSGRQRDSYPAKPMARRGKRAHIRSSGGGINIAYLFHYKSGAKPLMAAMWFEGSAADCERIEAIAREHLPSYDWRVPYESEEHGRWDSMWARDWGD